MDRYTYTLPIADATDALLKRANDHVAETIVGYRRQDRRRRQGLGAARPVESLYRDVAQAA
jgi:hypothetical protein